MKIYIIILFIFILIILLFIRQPSWKVKLITHKNITLWTESLGNPKNPACLLISGAGAPAKFWTDSFCKQLVKAGYFVIRFDHRDQGLSSAVDFEKHPYTALDIAQDAIAILDAYHINKAHIIGHSMGGMIAELLAIYYPNRVLSITSMSVGTVGQTGTPPKEIMDVLLENKPTQNFEADLPGFMRSWRVLNGKFPVDEKMATEYTKDLYRRSNHPVGVAWNHIRAQEKFQDLSDKLGTITVPSLFIHGQIDPLINVQAGIDAAHKVPGSKLNVIKNMGHMMFDKSLENNIVNLIIEHISKCKR